jgi:hypothetical protein
LSGQARGLIGPWGHTWPDKGVPGPGIDFMPEVARFLRFALEGEDNGWSEEPALVSWMQDAVPPAGTYAIRPGHWLAEPSWPSPNVFTVALALAPDGSLVAGAHDDELWERIDHDGLSIRGLQATGLAAGVWCGDATPGDSPTDQRPEDGASLCFDSAPLTEPLQLLGQARALIELTADRPRALVVARLCDLAPNGASTLISRGVLNLARRDGHDRSSPVVPGEPMHVEIPMQSTSYSMPPGHRLRLAISPTYWPWAWPSPETVTLTIHAGGASRLELPVRRAAEPPVLRPFAPPPETPPGPDDFSEDLSGAPGGRRVLSDLASGRIELEFDWTGDTRTRLLDPPVTELYEHNVTRYSIVEGDPLSAAVDCAVEVGLERDDWNIRVEVTAEMRCDLDSFSVRTRLLAFEDDVPVFEDDRSSVFPRDGV